MKIFLSGPMTGIKNYEHAFERIEDLLTCQGYTVVNPVTIAKGIILPKNITEEGAYSIYMKADIEALLKCDGMYQLKGWNLSKGALFEYETAKICGILTFEEA